MAGTHFAGTPGRRTATRYEPSEFEKELQQQAVAGQMQRKYKRNETVDGMNAQLQQFRREGRPVATVPGLGIGSDALIRKDIGPKDALQTQQELDRIGGMQKQPNGTWISVAGGAGGRGAPVSAPAASTAPAVAPPLAPSDLAGGAPSRGSLIQPPAPAATAAPLSSLKMPNLQKTGAGYVSTEQSASGPRQVGVTVGPNNIVNLMRAANPNWDSAPIADRTAALHQFNTGQVTPPAAVPAPLTTMVPGDPNLPPGATSGLSSKYGIGYAGHALTPEEMQGNTSPSRSLLLARTDTAPPAIAGPPVQTEPLGQGVSKAKPEDDEVVTSDAAKGYGIGSLAVGPAGGIVGGVIGAGMGTLKSIAKGGDYPDIEGINAGP